MTFYFIKSNKLGRGLMQTYIYQYGIKNFKKMTFPRTCYLKPLGSKNMIISCMKG